MKSLRRLDDRLAVIETALAVALQERHPGRRTYLLTVLERAAATAREEHGTVQDAQQRRSSFRVITGSVRGDRPEAAAPAGHWTGRIPDHATRSAG